MLMCEKPPLKVKTTYYQEFIKEYNQNILSTIRYLCYTLYCVIVYIFILVNLISFAYKYSKIELYFLEQYKPKDPSIICQR